MSEVNAVIPTQGYTFFFNFPSCRVSEEEMLSTMQETVQCIVEEFLQADKNGLIPRQN